MSSRYPIDDLEWENNSNGAALRPAILNLAELDDDLNAKAWQDTVPLLAQDPFALDQDRYAAFGRFMAGAGLIPAAPAVSDIAVGLR